MRVSRITIQSLLMSLCLLSATSIITGVYVNYSPRPFTDEEPTAIFLEIQKEAIGHQRAPVVKTIVKPTSPEKPPTSIDLQVVPRLASAETARAFRAATATVLEFSNIPIEHDPEINPNVPKVRVIPQVVTYASIPEAASSGGMVFSPSAAALPVPRIRRDMTDKYIKIAETRSPGKARPIVCGGSAGVPDVEHGIALRVGSEWEVEPLPKGEPGGRVIGRGRDIRGVFRLVRLKHDLADWWADQSSLVALVDWLNTQTKIRTDMNVEGGAIRLTDPKLSKAPLVFCTGHDSSLVISRELTRGAPLRGRLSKPERDGLRKYLIEDGGFVFFDDCGVNAPAQAFLRLVLAQLRYAMPEYSVDRIPNKHEIYNNYYKMSGPPIGFDIFWWGTHPPKRNYLEGIAIGDHLGVLVSRRDYMCSMRTISAPSWPTHYSPGAFRFSTNVVIYALTHGGISDYSHYVPEDNIDNIPIDSPVIVPALSR